MNHLTPAEVADYYAVHVATVRRWVAAGELPAYRVGGRVRIKLEDLDGFEERIIPQETA